MGGQDCSILSEKYINFNDNEQASTDPPSLNTSITAKGTATLTLESGFSTLIITIDDELC